MRAIIYARVSTDEQGDNFSLPSQINACRTYATERGMQVVAELQDVQSGAVLERPGLARARELARQRQIDAVIVYSLDRLSRNVAHTLLLRDELTEAGVTLHTCTRGQASDTPEGRMFDTLESAFAEYERLKIRERTIRGKRQKAANGRIVGEGAAPYGYRYEGSKQDRHLVIVPEEAEIVRTIYRWRVEGVGVYEIARRLTNMGAPTPSTVNPHSIGAYRRKRPAKYWTKTSVNHILSNPKYAGSVAQYDAIVTTPAIIDQETFELARIAAQRAKEQARRNTKHSYLLRGRVRCAMSGYAMCGHSTTRDGRPYRYYRAQKPPKDGVLNALLWETRAEPLEQAVWQWVVSLLDETTIREAISAARAMDVRVTLERRADRSVVAHVQASLPVASAVVCIPGKHC